MDTVRIRQRNWSSSATVLRVWIPAAYTVFVVSLLISAGFFYSGRQVRIEDALMSVLLSRRDNPHGYLIAAIGTAACGVFLLPTTTLFHNRLSELHRLGAATGAWIYRLGLVAVIAIGGLAPFQGEAFGPVHIYLAFLAFTGMVAGLAVCLGVAALGRTPGRLWLSGLAAIHTGELLFLIYVWFVPYPTQGYGPWTSVAALECGLCISIAVGTTALVLALDRPPSSH